MDEITKKQIRSKLSDYVSLITEPSPKAGKDMYICPICGSGTGKDHSGAFHVTGETWYCHNASHDSGGDIFTLFAEMNNLDVKRDFPQIIDGLTQALGVIEDSSDYAFGWDDPIQDDRQPDQEEQKEEKQMNQERINQINYYASKLSGSPAETYFRERGFSDEIIKRYQLGYDSVKKAVVIPYPGTDYFTKRLISPTEDQPKYINLPGEAPIFTIKNTKLNYFFITEGQLDALSLIQAGTGNVIASHYPSKIEDLIDNGFKIDGAVIVADNDEPGKKIAEKLTDLFSEKKITSMTVYPPDGFKDSNDLLQKDPDELTALIRKWGNELIELLESEQPEEQPEERSKVINVGSYLTEDVYEQDIEYFRRYKDRKIGFGNIDRYMTLYPGLCCLGGASSLGKTTFAVNIVDNLLEKGESVIYFSLEQLPIELITKSLARRLHYLDPASTLTNIDLKNGASSDSLTRAKKDYIRTARNYTIVEGDFHVTAEKIIKAVESYINNTGIKPIVVIDYLQLIAPPKGFKGTQREIIDESLKALKDLSKRNELFILLISSFNRASYKEPVSMESFKESGMIEYTCDYIFGLQLSILEDSSFYTSTGVKGGEKENNNDKKEKKLFEAMDQDPKEIELVVLKNRNGKQRFKCFFKYEMKYDTFTPDFNSKYDKYSAMSEEEFKKQYVDSFNDLEPDD